MREYIRDSFHPDDWLAVVTKRERFQQHFVTAEELLNRQAQLQTENDKGANIYVSMNALVPEAQNRTKQDIAAIRHIYLDIDHNGRDALARITADTDAPRPSYILNTSPDKYQVIWKVAGFSPNEAEALQRAMAVRYGADRAATDVTRVLRIPGFDNRKYNTPYMVTAEKVSDQIYQPSDFRIDRQYEHVFVVKNNPVNHTPRTAGATSQSERDWFETCRRIERGDNPADVRNWLESSRQDKPNPRYYTELTVSRALTHCAANIKSISKQENNTMENASKGLTIGSQVAGLAAVSTADLSPKAREAAEWLIKNGFENEKDVQAAFYYRQTSAMSDDFNAEKNDEANIVRLANEYKKKNNAPEKTEESEKPRVDSTPRKEQESRHYLIGNTYAVKDQLKELGCRYDAKKETWFHTDKAVAEKAQALVPAQPEKHLIGSAPKELSSALKEMGAKWNEKDGWYHSDKTIAETARQKILEAEPRHYLTGASLAVKDQLKELGCRWDGDKKQWYATNKELADFAQNLINNGGKTYIPNVPFKLNEKVREMGCQWDSEKKCWYHRDPAIAKEVDRLAKEERERSPNHGRQSVVQSLVKEVAHEM